MDLILGWEMMARNLPTSGVTNPMLDDLDLLGRINAVRYPDYETQRTRIPVHEGFLSLDAIYTWVNLGAAEEGYVEVTGKQTFFELQEDKRNEDLPAWLQAICLPVVEEGESRVRKWGELPVPTEIDGVHFVAGSYPASTSAGGSGTHPFEGSVFTRIHDEESDLVVHDTLPHPEPEPLRGMRHKRNRSAVVNEDVVDKARAFYRRKLATTTTQQSDSDS